MTECQVCGSHKWDDEPCRSCANTERERWWGWIIMTLVFGLLVWSCANGYDGNPGDCTRGPYATC
jgi:hypothetical protein